MRTTPIPNPLPGPSPRIRSWRVSRASHNAPRPPKPHNLSHEPLLQDTSKDGTSPPRKEFNHDPLATRSYLLSLAAYGHAGPGGEARLRGDPERGSRPAGCAWRRRSRPEVLDLCQACRPGRHAEDRRRIAPLRLERL